MKFNQLVDDTAEKFEVTQAVNFADLARPAKLQKQFSQLKNQYNNCFNKLFINGKQFTLLCLDWSVLINGNYLKESLIGIFGYPWYVLEKIAVLWTVFNFYSSFLDYFVAQLVHATSNDTLALISY